MPSASLATTSTTVFTATFDQNCNFIATDTAVALTLNEGGDTLGGTTDTLKLQPVFPFRLNEDWTVLTRTIFRFVSAPSATPELGLTPMGEPVLLGWNQRNRMSLSDVSPTAFLVPNLGPDWTFGFGPSLVISRWRWSHR